MIKFTAKEDAGGKSATLTVGGKNVSPFYVSIVILTNKAWMTVTKVLC